MQFLSCRVENNKERSDEDSYNCVALILDKACEHLEGYHEVVGHKIPMNFPGRLLIIACLSDLFINFFTL